MNFFIALLTMALSINAYGTSSDKKFSASFRSGLITGMGLTPGIELSYLKSQYQFSTMYYKADLKNISSFASDVELDISDRISHNLFIAHMRCFLSESFYFALGLGQRHYNMAYESHNKIDSSFVSLDIKSTSIVGYYTIGNMWILENGLLIGFDWLGQVRPINHKFEIKTQTSENDSDLDTLQGLINDHVKELGQTSTLVAFLLNLGWSF
ncbi:MAG: hypothetical protein R3B45_09835 [Bdellovibrionota bacterium]